MDSEKAKHVIAKVREKQGVANIADMQEQLQKQLQNEALRDILKTTLMGAGIAGTVRGGQGLWNLLLRSPKELRSRPGVAPLPVPYRPSFKDEDEKNAFVSPAMLIGAGVGGGYGLGSAPEGEALPNVVHHGIRGLGTGAGYSGGALLGATLAQRLSKDKSGKGNIYALLAGLLGGGLGGGILGNKLTKSVLGKSPGERESKEDEKADVLLQRAEQARSEHDDDDSKWVVHKYAEDFTPGVTNKSNLWWYMPAMLGAGALGGVGGWKLIDKILDNRRRKEIDDEVDASRGEFQNALVSQYKQGSDSELGVALDELYLKMQKAAKAGDWLDPNTYFTPDQVGRGKGMYATYAIPSALLGYLFVKKMADKGSRRQIIEKAQRRRALKQQRARPAELYAVPSPIDEEEE